MIVVVILTLILTLTLITTTNNKKKKKKKMTNEYTQSPSQDFRFFGPRPWKVLAATYDKKKISEQPRPWRKS